MNTSRFFLKADIRFTLERSEHMMSSVDFALNGVHGLSVPGVDPLLHVGKTVPVQIEVKIPDPVSFSVKATLAAVIGTDWSSFAFRFRTPRELQDRLAQAIDTEGFEPAWRLRRFPRLPASGAVSSMPEHAIVHSLHGPIAFSVANLSPGGILLATESPRAAIVVPGMAIRAQLEARGRVLNASEVRGTARRLEVYRHARTGNIVYAIGVCFDASPEGERSSLMPVLNAMAEDLAAQDRRAAEARTA